MTDCNITKLVQKGALNNNANFFRLKKLKNIRSHSKND